MDGKLYQDVGVDKFLRPETLLKLVAERSGSLPERDFVIFCGTYASVDKTMGFGRAWRVEIADPVRGRAIAHEYRVDNILAEIRPEFRVPLSAKPL